MNDIKRIVVRLSDCCEFLVGRNIDKSKLVKTVVIHVEKQK
jgi:hypothetical protein